MCTWSPSQIGQKRRERSLCRSPGLVIFMSSFFCWLSLRVGQRVVQAGNLLGTFLVVVVMLCILRCLCMLRAANLGVPSPWTLSQCSSLMCQRRLPRFVFVVSFVFITSFFLLLRYVSTNECFVWSRDSIRSLGCRRSRKSRVQRSGW
jgi:hypothetical protein